MVGRPDQARRLEEPSDQERGYDALAYVASTPNWEQRTLKDAAGADVDAPDLSPSQGLRIRFREQDPGRWLYHCHVMTHMEAGMVGYYLVS